MSKHLLTVLLVSLLLPYHLCYAKTAKHPSYKVEYSGSFVPDRGVVTARITVTQSRHVLRWLDLAADPGKFSKFSGDGEIQRDGDRLLWTLPPGGGSLSYEVIVDNQRGQSMDARMTEDWAMLRMDDLFPAARIGSLKNSVSRSFLSLDGPPSWSIESRYGPAGKQLSISTPGRRFDRPTGWLVAGDHLGVRRTTVADRKLTVASPVGQGMHRQDLLAFMRWTLPELVGVFPEFPETLLIVGAKDDMWRGGLSGPASLYLHTERPLISENATSALLHELVHMVTGEVKVPKDDWIIEGLAEYYSLQILLRSGGISNLRYEKTLRQLTNWADREHGVLKSPSSGANTARAVLTLNQFQSELTKHKAGSLDTVIQALLKSEAMTGKRLLELTEKQLGADSPELRNALKTWSRPAS